MVSLKVPVSVATETNGNGPTTRLRDYATAFCDKESVLVFTNKAGDGQTSQGQKPALINTKKTGKVPRSL